MKVSRFADRFSSSAGIVRLMDDLGSAMAGNDMLMLGGGNPAHIPEVQQYFHERLQRLLDRPAELAKVIGNYDSPAGEEQFITALCQFFKEKHGWHITEDNIVLSCGSQSAFFMLFNMFAGEFSDGRMKKVLLPMAPEYIGYSDLGLSDDMFISIKPRIDQYAAHRFKYHVDFDELHLDDSIGAICVSRPSNPTGNVLTEDEMTRLMQLSEQRQIPLIIDGAYGLPFPNILFEEVKPVWNENTILCLSLSKLGLPGTRTGIVIASSEITEYLKSMNAIINLAQGSFGAALAYDLINSGDIEPVCKNIIKPFYQQRAVKTLELIDQNFTGFEYFVHKPEGAIFLWLWFPEMTISSEVLYQRLKQRGVLVLSGHHFFPGLEQDWLHTQQCIRITYSQAEQDVEQAIKIIAEEVSNVS